MRSSLYRWPKQEIFGISSIFSFLQYASNSRISCAVSGVSSYMRDLGVDIVFVQQRNIVDGNTELLRIAGCLDEALELFPYACDGKQVMLRTYERQWQNDDGELHYQFHIKQRVLIGRETDPMERMEENNAHIRP